MQKTLRCKEKRIYILSQAPALLHQRPIIGNTTHHHIRLQQIISRISQAHSLAIFLTLVKGERLQEYLIIHAIMKSAMIPENLIDNPGCGRTANNEQDVVSHGSPSIPEKLQSRDKLRPRRIHPRHFVDENNFLLR